MILCIRFEFIFLWFLFAFCNFVVIFYNLVVFLRVVRAIDNRPYVIEYGIVFF